MAERSPTPRKVPPKLIVKAVIGLRNSLIRLAAAIAPPQVTMFEHVSGVGKTMVAAHVARLKIADLLAHGPLKIAELAQKTQTHEETLWRVMRAAVAMGVFDLQSDGRFANNRTSEVLRSDVFASMRDLAEYFGSESNTRPWIDMAETLRTGKNGFERVYGKSVWDYFGEHPDESATFARAMTNLTEFDASAIAVGYPFDELGVICDVAGSRGTLITAILKQNKNARGILFDEAHVLAHADDYLRKSGVDTRIEKIAGSFFKKIPSGADAYLLKDILHDWDDDRSITILKNCRAAMEVGKRLLIVEIVVEKNETELPGPLIDLQMMTITCEGRQRSASDFENLFQKAGFRFERVVELAMPISIVEGFAI